MLRGKKKLFPKYENVCKDYLLHFLARRTTVLSLSIVSSSSAGIALLFNNLHNTPQSVFVRLLVTLQDLILRQSFCLHEKYWNF